MYVFLHPMYLFLSHPLGLYRSAAAAYNECSFNPARGVAGQGGRRRTAVLATIPSIYHRPSETLRLPTLR